MKTERVSSPYRSENEGNKQISKNSADTPEQSKTSGTPPKKTLFKCKICGATVSTDGTSKLYSCKKCGSEQPVSDFRSEHVSFLYGRANHYFRTKRFDKALNIYQQIAAESPDDCEAYRSIVLSRYGISYNSENGTYNREPQINRVHSDSILDDADYLHAVSLADDERRSFYIKEAEMIDRISQEILELSQIVPTFDAVIVYRGHDSKNRYTPEKAMAEELYRQLEESGFRVYNRQITAPVMAGHNYDAYLYKALYSAKIMFVLASKQEYFNDTKLVNEWSIFSERMRNKEKKVIVNCIGEMEEDDIPEELRKNMVYNFTEIAFIRKMIELTEQVVNGTLFLQAGRIDSDNEDSISERLGEIFRLIENESYYDAENKCHTFLSSYPDNSSAYLALLLCDMKVRRKEELADCKETFVRNKNYRKILLLDKEMSDELQKYLDTINDRYLQGVYERKYEYALDLYLNGQSNKNSMLKAKNTFELLNEYKDSTELAEKCSLIIKELETQEAIARADELIDKASIFLKRAEELQQYHYVKLAFECLDNAESICQSIQGAEQLMLRAQKVRNNFLPPVVNSLIDRALKNLIKAEDTHKFHYAKLAFEDLDNAERICQYIEGPEQLMLRSQEVRKKYSPLYDKLEKKYLEQERKQITKEKIKNFLTKKL